MAVQIPIDLVNKTGPVWDQFVLDAQRAGVAADKVGEAADRVVQKLQRTVDSRSTKSLADSFGGADAERSAQRVVNVQRKLSADIGKEQARQAAEQARQAAEAERLAERQASAQARQDARFAATSQQTSQRIAQMHRMRAQAVNLATDQMEGRLSGFVKNMNAMNITPRGYEMFAFRASKAIEGLGAMSGPLIAVGAAAFGSVKAFHAMRDAGDRDALSLQNSLDKISYAGGKMWTALGNTEAFRSGMKEATSVADGFANYLETGYVPRVNRIMQGLLEIWGKGDSPTARAMEEDMRRDMAGGEESIRARMLKAERKKSTDGLRGEETDFATSRTTRFIGKDFSTSSLESDKKRYEKELADSDSSMSISDPRSVEAAGEKRRQILAIIKALNNQILEVEKQREEVWKNIGEHEQTRAGLKLDASLIPTLREVNTLYESELKYLKKRIELGGIDKDEQVRRFHDLSQLESRRHSLLAEQRDTERDITAFRKEQNELPAKEIGDIAKIDAALKEQLETLGKLNKEEKLSAEEKSTREKEIQRLLQGRKQLQNELLGIAEKEKEFAKSRKAEISDLHTITEVEQRQISIEKEMQDLKLKGLLTTKDEIRLREQLLQTKERELQIAREQGRQMIEQARAEFQKVIAARAGVFGGKAGEQAGSGMIDQLRGGIGQGDVMKQLAMDRAKGMDNPFRKKLEEMKKTYKKLMDREDDPSTTPREKQAISDQRAKMRADAGTVIDKGDAFERQMFGGQMAGLRNGRIGFNQRGPRNVSRNEVQRAQNEVARRKLQQQMERGEIDPFNGQAMSDALEADNRRLMDEAQRGDAMNGMQRGGVRNRRQQLDMNRRQMQQNRGQMVPRPVDNMPGLMQGVAQQQAGAFQAQGGLNQQLIGALQQAQQAALAAQQQTANLQRQVQGMVEGFGARQRAIGLGAF